MDGGFAVYTLIYFVFPIWSCKFRVLDRTKILLQLIFCKISDVSISPTCNLNEVVAKLCFYRALHLVKVGTEYNCIKFLHHLAWAKRTKVSAASTRRAA